MTTRPPPPEIPGYALDRVLGSGGMGVVWAGRRLADGEPVALKILSSTLADERRVRFEQEGRILLTLDHPDIVAVHETGCTPDGFAWIAMEQLDGCDLATAMHDPSFGLQERLQVLTRTARALQYAHDADIVHRDVKPANIFLTRDGDVRLLDFGIAKLEDRRITQPGTLHGTPEYMPPEHVLGQGFDHRGDVFSLGVVAYELLANAPPWPRSDVNAHLISVCVVPPRPFRDMAQAERWLGLHPRLVEELHTVIHKAIDVDRSRRFSSMNAFAAALERVAELALAPELDARVGAPKLPDNWAARRLEWSRARAARLLRDSAPKVDPITKPAPPPPRPAGVTQMIEREVKASLTLWRVLVGVFVVALAVLLYLIAR